MPNIEAIQIALRQQKIDGWLFYDILHRDPIAYRVLGLDHALAKRRWFYMIPAKGAPRKLVHRIEAATLDSLPGDKMVYAAAEEMEKNLKKLVGRVKKVAMQYSPKNSIPYISLVDAGTVELIRAQGCKVVSSADLVQQFESAWTPEQLESHRAAGRAIDAITQAWPSGRTLVIRTTSLESGVRRPSVGAICCCSTSGRKHSRRTASTMTSRGLGFWARMFPTNVRRFSRLCVKPATRPCISCRKT
jgi:hypothetical protein